MTNFEAVVKGFRAKTVVVFGDAMLDEYIEGAFERISNEAPVPLVSFRARRRVPGGAANVAANVAALGARSILVCCLGNDAEAGELRKLCSAAGITLEAVATARPTTLKTRIVALQKHLLRIDREVTSPVTAAEESEMLALLEKHAAKADCILVADYNKGCVTEKTAKHLVSGHASRLFVDTKPDHVLWFRGSRVIKPNFSEALRMCGLLGREFPAENTDANVREMCAFLNSKLSSDIVVSRGRAGASYFGKSGFLTEPSVGSGVLDVSGAGDTFTSVCALSSLDLPVAEAIKLANAASAVKVSRFGTVPVSASDLLAFIANPPKPGKAAGAAEPLAGSGKIRTAAEISKICDSLRSQGRKIVFTNGVFDLLHSGHVSSLRLAKQKGDVLVVGLNTDASVKKFKDHRRPIRGCDDRAQTLAAIEYVDFIVPFDEETPEELVRLVKPDVLIKGAEYRGKFVAGADFVRKRGGEVFFVEHDQNVSSTDIIKSICEKYGRQ